MLPVSLQLAQAKTQAGRSPLLLKTNSWRLDGWSVPAGDEGGDFVLTHWAAEALRVWIGDVTGHGAAAARASVAVRRILRPFVREPLSLRIMRRASELVYRALQGERFVAITALELHPCGNRAVIANAGNPAVLLHRPGARRVDRFQSTGMPLGLVRPDEWQPPGFALTYLEAGERFVCYTDGVADEPGRNGSFGLRRIIRSLLRSGDSVAADVGQRVSAFRDPRLERDDMTFLTIASCASAGRSETCRGVEATGARL